MTEPKRLGLCPIHTVLVKCHAPPRWGISFPSKTAIFRKLFQTIEKVSLHIRRNIAKDGYIRSECEYCVADSQNLKKFRKI
jgi:hypothetical protein